jgi:hypothetical protein
LECIGIVLSATIRPFKCKSVWAARTAPAVILSLPRRVLFIVTASGTPCGSVHHECFQKSNSGCGEGNGATKELSLTANKAFRNRGVCPQRHLLLSRRAFAKSSPSHLSRAGRKGRRLLTSRGKRMRCRRDSPPNLLKKSS